MASTRPLILWLLEQGHQPQALQLDMQIGTADWQEAAVREAELLQEEGESNIHLGYLEQLRELGVELETLDASSDSTDDSLTTIWHEHAQASSELSEELRQILEQAIDLRDQGNPDQSRELLEQQANQGVRSPWLADNLARCLVDLDRKAEALTIWQALSTSPHAGVAEPAAERAAQVEAGLVQDQRKPVSVWQEHAQASSELSDELRQILEQAIDLREQGNSEESRALLELQVNLGMRSPWLAGNLARCLVNLDRKPEALEIWHALAQSSDAGVAQQAVEMASRIEAELATNQESPLSIWQEHAEASSDLSDELRQLLDEAIALREQGNANQSLELLEQRTASGVRSPWLAGNMARCLVNLDRKSEALEIWQVLAESPDTGVAKQASKMVEQVEAGLVDSLLTRCREIVELFGESLQHVQPTKDKNIKSVMPLILEEAIRLREAGSPQCSLDMLQTAEQHELTNEWVKENQARALVHLDRRSDAIAIWEKLTSSDKSNVAGIATEMVERHRPKLVGDVNRRLRQQLEREGRIVGHLPELPPSQLDELELPILQEAIALRQQGDALLSLQLLETALTSGIQSPWIDDNRARALVNLERYSEAVNLWQKLQDCGNATVEKSATEMLERNAVRGREQGVLREVEKIMENPEGANAKAIERLTDAILENPDCEAWQAKLREITTTQENGAKDSTYTFPELQEHRQVIDSFDAILTVLERRINKKDGIGASKNEIK